MKQMAPFHFEVTDGEVITMRVIASDVGGVSSLPALALDNQVLHPDVLGASTIYKFEVTKPPGQTHFVLLDIPFDIPFVREPDRSGCLRCDVELTGSAGGDRSRFSIDRFSSSPTVTLAFTHGTGGGMNG